MPGREDGDAVLIDVDYHHYQLTLAEVLADGDEPEFGPSGSAVVAPSRVLVSCHTQAGPLSARVLVGDFAPGPAEDGWRAEWESVQDLTVDVVSGGELLTWEGAPVQPPTGQMVRPGRWGVRFHARGAAKVAEDAIVEAPLEEHLFLLWPADAPAGDEPVWDEVVGEPTPAGRFHVDELRDSGKVKTAAGFYRLSWGPSPADVSGFDAPPEPALILTDQELLVATGTRRSLEVFFDGSPSRPREITGSGWRALDEVTIHAAHPVRLLDENGVPPRRFDDPLLPPGDWTVQVRVRRTRTDMPDELYRGREHDQMVCVWAAGALTREEDIARWGADEFDSPDDDDTRGDFDGGDFVVEVHLHSDKP